MTTSNVNDAVDALLRKWKTEDVRIGDANTQRKIENFEQGHKVRLPQDFKLYLLRANGMRPGIPHDTDKNGYCFWPLERIRSVANEFREPQHRAKEIHRPELASYFIFADYLQWSWAYAIRIAETDTDTSIVFRVDAPQTIWKLADSFAEFIDLYVVDSVRLYDRAANS
jgi:hypothetical protein